MAPPGQRLVVVERGQGEHRRAQAAIAKIIDHLVQRGDSADQIVEYVAGMTDRFALAYAEKL